jgi:hypothetical protein
MSNLKGGRHIRRRSGNTHMSKSISLLLLICIAGCASTPQQANGPVTNYFDCDVPAGKFSEWDQTILSKGAHLSGTIQMMEARKDPKWIPAASVFLVDGENLSAVGFQVVLYKSDSINVSLSMLGLGGESGRFTLATRPWEGKLIPFTLDLSDQGNLTLHLDGASRTVSVNPFRLKKVKLSCSTGQFKFRDVQIAGR